MSTEHQGRAISIVRRPPVGHDLVALSPRDYGHIALREAEQGCSNRRALGLVMVNPQDLISIMEAQGIQELASVNYLRRKTDPGRHI